jgi:hypothetical protein
MLFSPRGTVVSTAGMDGTDRPTESMFIPATTIENDVVVQLGGYESGLPTSHGCKQERTVGLRTYCRKD